MLTLDSLGAYYRWVGCLLQVVDPGAPGCLESGWSWVLGLGGLGARLGNAG